MDQGLDEFWFSGRQLSSVIGVNGNVTEGSSAVVLYINIGRREELN